MSKISERINQLQQRLSQSAQACNRATADICLLAVSKTRSIEEIRCAQAAGLSRFGENYLQEALGKIEQLGHDDYEWHFIGPIQSNKTRDIATHFDWVQSVDRLKIAQRLSQQRNVQQAPLNVCVQVNISAEPQKAGVAAEEAADLCHAIQALPQLQLRGLMVIPAATSDPQAQRASFEAAQQLYEALRAEGLPLDTLSMGMSADWPVAIAAGSNMIRVGSDIFGPRL